MNDRNSGSGGKRPPGTTTPRHPGTNTPRPPGTNTPVTSIDRSAPSGRVVAAAVRYPGNDRYVLDKQIATGGMGRVFSGRDLRLFRTVAIKMLRLQDAALARRFEREVRLAARLQHPGVVPVYDAGFWPSGEPFLVMKLVLGQSLARVVKDADTREDRLGLLPQVIAAAEAVAYAHDQGIVHRDLKPSNILVGAFGETVVVDWGLAKDLRAQDSVDRALGDAKRQRQLACRHLAPDGEQHQQRQLVGQTGRHIPSGRCTVRDSPSATARPHLTTASWPIQPYCSVLSVR